MISLNVTVAVPSYNSEPFLIKTVESILAQTRTVNEIVIIDDCSTDKSYEIACELRGKHTNIKAYRNDDNLGYAKNWNNCIKYCQTKFLLILHHDDLLKSDTIEKQLNFFGKNREIALVGGLEDGIDENGKSISLKEPTGTKIFEKGQILGQTLWLIKVLKILDFMAGCRQNS